MKKQKINRYFISICADLKMEISDFNETFYEVLVNFKNKTFPYIFLKFKLFGTTLPKRTTT